MTDDVDVDVDLGEGDDVEGGCAHVELGCWDWSLAEDATPMTSHLRGQNVT